MSIMSDSDFNVKLPAGFYWLRWNSDTYTYCSNFNVDSNNGAILDYWCGPIVEDHDDFKSTGFGTSFFVWNQNTLTYKKDLSSYAAKAFTTSDRVDQLAFNSQIDVRITDLCGNTMSGAKYYTIPAANLADFKVLPQSRFYENKNNLVVDVENIGGRTSNWCCDTRIIMEVTRDKKDGVPEMPINVLNNESNKIETWYQKKHSDLNRKCLKNSTFTRSEPHDDWWTMFGGGPSMTITNNAGVLSDGSARRWTWSGKRRSRPWSGSGIKSGISLCTWPAHQQNEIIQFNS